MLADASNHSLYKVYSEPMLEPSDVTGHTIAVNKLSNLQAVRICTGVFGYSSAHVICVTKTCTMRATLQSARFLSRTHERHAESDGAAV